jgi:biotin synthase
MTRLNDLCSGTVRQDWTRAEAEAVLALPFADLLFAAQTVHRMRFDPNTIETASLLSIKTGGCPEDCGYCSQSVHHKTSVAASKLMDFDAVLNAAKQAKAGGAQRFCMGAAWRNPNDRDLGRVCEMVSAVKALGMETCATLGMLRADQAQRLKQAGLDFYNHNVDTSPEYYGEITTTRTYDDRLNTLAEVRAADIKVCCGGIVGIGEAEDDRVGLLLTLATLPSHPESVPINLWNEVEGAPVQARAKRLDPLELVRLVALARIMMPASVVRLSAGRQYLSDEAQALCFFAGASSIFLGQVLLTTANPELSRDTALLQKLGVGIGQAEARVADNVA